jgi:hypothetical protein
MLKVQSADFTAGTVVTGKCLLCSVTIISNNAVDATITVYDNTAASGTVLHADSVAFENSAKTVTFPHPISANNGLHFAITGTGASGNITYSTSGY